MSFDGLNPVQRQAVEAVGRPVLIFAGAGSGKTRVLTHKIAHLIRAEKVQPEQVLAVTFTNKAAREMQTRVAKLLGVRSLPLSISTFHSACARILRQEIHRLGYRNEFVIYDVEDQASVIRDLLAEVGMASAGVTAGSVQNRISFLKNRMLNPSSNGKHKSGRLEEIVEEIFPRYARRLQRNNAVDFDDLLLLPLRLFEEHPKVLAGYRDRFRHILVDEYQDTNRPQFLLIKALGEKHGQVCVVGDDDQSIYGWRGADVSNILEFQSIFPGCQVFHLEQNYRSTQTILTGASAMVKNNVHRAEKTLWTERQGGAQIGLFQAMDEEEEADGVGEILGREILQHKRKFSDFALLYRTNVQSRPLEEMLRRKGIPYVILGGIRFYERKEIKDLLSYLRAIINPSDTVSLKRIINFPTRGIGIRTVEKCEELANARKVTLLESFADPAAVQLKGKQAAAMTGFCELIGKFRKLTTKLDASELAAVLVDELGLVNFYKKQGTEEARERLDNVQELLNSIHEFVSRSEKASLAEFLQEVSLFTDLDLWEDKSNQVTLMTLHSSKGLEFPVVFVTGLEEGLLPIERSLDSQAQLEEERRLLYVGLTRAKDRVVFTYANHRRRSAGAIQSYSGPSRFLQEIPQELFERITFRSSVIKRTVAQDGSGEVALRTVRTVTAFDDFKRGDKVLHKLFGRGMILSVEGGGENQKVSVIFQGNVRKKLVARYAQLIRIR